MLYPREGWLVRAVLPEAAPAQQQTGIQTALANLSKGEGPYPPTPETDVVVVVRRFVPVTVRHPRVPGIVVPRIAAERWGLVPMGLFSQKFSWRLRRRKKKKRKKKKKREKKKE
jgi:hypothetical protein